MVPVTELILCLTELGIPLHQAVGPAEEHRLDGHHIANRPVVNSFNGFLKAKVESAL